MAAPLTITETTMAPVEGIRIGVSNVWEAEYKDAAGATQTGPTAMLSLAEADGHDLMRQRVHVGSIVEAAGHRIRIESVNAPATGLGSVTLVVLPVTP